MFNKALYKEHNASLDHFITIFNENKDNLMMILNPRENYMHDGLFIDFDSGRTAGFDWTKRQKICFEKGKYKYDDFFILSRRLKIKSNEFFIETDANEDHILLTSSKNFENSEERKIHITRDGETELISVKYTDEFKVFSYDSIEDFKAYIKQQLNKED
ncbi:MAG: hypothetical protein LUB59_04840 [Candidatus Gastranaerophilales bacterium]|nr:hypothetical protein [Candidatus Gastranaerophilales bacterium]